jgi:hypothetical protein
MSDGTGPKAVLGGDGAADGEAGAAVDAECVVPVVVGSLTSSVVQSVVHTSIPVNPVSLSERSPHDMHTAISSLPQSPHHQCGWTSTVQPAAVVLELRLLSINVSTCQ